MDAHQVCVGRRHAAGTGPARKLSTPSAAAYAFSAFCLVFLVGLLGTGAGGSRSCNLDLLVCPPSSAFFNEGLDRVGAVSYPPPPVPDRAPRPIGARGASLSLHGRLPIWRCRGSRVPARLPRGERHGRPASRRLRRGCRPHRARHHSLRDDPGHDGQAMRLCLTPSPAGGGCCGIGRTGIDHGSASDVRRRWRLLGVAAGGRGPAYVTDLGGFAPRLRMGVAAPAGRRLVAGA